MTPFEREICFKVQQGDIKAFEYVFKSHFSMLCSYACDLLKDPEQAREVVQELMIKIWEDRNHLNINVSLKSYLYRCVHNQCINLLKHNLVVKKLKNHYEEDVLLSSGLSASSDEEYTLECYLYDGIEKDIDDAVNSLPDQCRHIFYLSRFERLSYSVIASKLNISVNTVKTQMRRALEKIRTSITRKISGHFKEIDK